MIVKIWFKKWRGNCSAEDESGYCSGHGLDPWVHAVPCWGTAEKPCDAYIVTHLVEGGEFERVVEVREDEERPCNCGSGVHWAFCPANSPYCG